MARRRGQHGRAFLPAALAGVAAVHAAGILVAHLWFIYKLDAPDLDKERMVDLSDYVVEEIALLETPPPELDLPLPEEEVEERDEEPPPDDEPKVELEKKQLARLEPARDRKVPPPRPEEKKLEKKPEPPKLEPPKLVKKEPPKPIPPPPPPPEVVAKPPQPKQPPPKFERKKMVEVDDDKSIVSEPPPDVNYYSDKNRRPAEETYAKDRNLEKSMKGKSPPSAKSDDKTSEEVGGPEEKVAKSEETEATTLDKKKQVASVHRGTRDHAEGIRSGDKGQGGQEGRGGQGGQGGEGGSGGQNGTAGALSMREAKGLGVTPGGPTPAPSGGPNDDAPVVSMSRTPGGKIGAPGAAGDPGRVGKPGKRGPKLNLDTRDYTRIVGEDKAEEEVALAKKKRSAKKGKWEKKMAKIQSSLETFSGEVKPGNQTALGTRAHPFAVYIARMHNRIHEVWGFGFLADLDRKSQSNPMNDRTLAVTLEIVVAPDGEVTKAVIVRPSGVLTFDVAAVDVVMALGPYEETPADIRSGDGNVYMHWTFHRDERMCSPYFADPYILENGSPNKDAAAQAEPGRAPPKQLSRNDQAKGDGTDGAVQVPRVRAEQVPPSDSAASSAVQQELPTPDDPRANDAALAWGNAFEKGDVAGLIALSTVPFHSRGAVVANDEGTLAQIWMTVLQETDTRRISEWQLLTPAGYRAAFGHLPAGAEDGTRTLFLVARVGNDMLTLEVMQMTDGSYRLSGFSR